MIAKVDPFSDPQAVARYIEGPPRIVPGFEGMQRMTTLLLAERAPEAARVLVLGAGGVTTWMPYLFRASARGRSSLLGVAQHQSFRHDGGRARGSADTRGCREVMGCSLQDAGSIEYQRLWRLASANDELHLGQGLIAEFAFAVGFQSTSAFIATFTQAVGCPPRRLVEQARR